MTASELRSKIPTCQEIKEVQDTLGQFIEHPWYDYEELTSLPANGLEILQLTLNQLDLLQDVEPQPIRHSINTALKNLNALRQEIAAVQPDPETGYPLNAEQIFLYCQTWEDLEKTRRSLAITMLDDIGPYMGVIDDPEMQASDLIAAKKDRYQPITNTQKPGAPELKAVEKC